MPLNMSAFENKDPEDKKGTPREPALSSRGAATPNDPALAPKGTPKESPFGPRKPIKKPEAAAAASAAGAPPQQQQQQPPRSPNVPPRSPNVPANVASSIFGGKQLKKVATPEVTAAAPPAKAGGKAPPRPRLEESVLATESQANMAGLLGGGGGGGASAEPKSPMPIQRVIPLVKEDREEVEVLAPEERREMERKKLAQRSSLPATNVQVRSEREEVEVLPPEERRRLAMQQQQQGKAVNVEVAYNREQVDVLPPEERRRLAREAAEAAARAAGKPPPPPSSVPSSSRKSSVVSRRESVVSPGGQPPSLVGTPLIQITTPRTPAGQPPCPRCDALQQRVDELEANAADLTHQVSSLRADKAALQTEVASKKKGAHKEESSSKAAKKHKEELAKKDGRIIELERELRDAEKRAVSAQLHASKRMSVASSGALQRGGGDAEHEAALAQKDAELAELRARVDQLERELQEVDSFGDTLADPMDLSIASGSQFDDEAQMLASQVWALETAVEFRAKEITRLQGLLDEFVTRVSQLDEELALAMRQLMDAGSSASAQEEAALLGGKSIDELVVDLQEKRTEAKEKKKKRRPRRGKLARENADLREQLEDLREAAAGMRKAMAEKNPAMFIAAMKASPGAMMAVGAGGAAGAGGAGAFGGAAMPTKACCFQAAFVAAGQAEAQKEELSTQVREKNHQIDRMKIVLNKARDAIVATAGVGYENEVKLQQARKALQLILDYPDSTGVLSPGAAAASPEQQAVKGPPARAIASPPALASPASVTAALTHAVYSPRPAAPAVLGSPMLGSPGLRTVSPQRKQAGPASHAIAWMYANPQHAPRQPSL